MDSAGPELAGRIIRRQSPPPDARDTAVPHQGRVRFQPVEERQSVRSTDGVAAVEESETIGSRTEVNVDASRCAVEVHCGMTRHVLHLEPGEVRVVLLEAEGVIPGLELDPGDILDQGMGSARLEVVDHHLVLPGCEGRCRAELSLLKERPLRMGQVPRGMVPVAAGLDCEE